MASVWKGFRFRDPEKEAEFQQRYRDQSYTRACICLLSLAFLDAACILMSVAHSFNLLWPLVTEFLLCGGLLGLLWAKPRLRKYTAPLALTTLVVHVAVALLGIQITTNTWRKIATERVSESTTQWTAQASLLPAEWTGLDGEGRALCHPDVVERFEGRMEKQRARHITAIAILIFGYLLGNIAMVDYSKGMVLALMIVALMTGIKIFLEPSIAADTGIVSQLVFLTLLACIVWPLTTCTSFNLGQRRQFEAEFSHEKTMEATRAADAVLHHTLKNNMADAAGRLEAALEEEKFSELPASTISDVRTVINSLWRGMRSCRHREVHVQLKTGTYTVVWKRLSVLDFFLEHARGWVLNSVMPDLQAILDPLLLSLIVDSALSNAYKHGHPTSPDVEVSVDDRPGQGLVFCVTNKAHPDRPPLTDGVWWSLTEGPGPQSTHTMSDGIGLQHSHLAAQASSTTIRLRQQDGLVTFEACVKQVPPADVQVDLAGPAEEAVDLSAFPAGLVVCCIDDVPMSLAVLKVGLQQHCLPSRIGVYGGDGPPDVARFVRDALGTAHIAILDYHLDFPGKMVLGLEVVASLRAAGFAGLLCMRSGNTSAADIDKYMAGGCHCVISKDMRNSEAMDVLKAAYLRLNPPGPPGPLVPVVPLVPLVPLVDVSPPASHPAPASGLASGSASGSA